jgi:hypothetical protein
MKDRMLLSAVIVACFLTTMAGKVIAKLAVHPQKKG